MAEELSPLDAGLLEIGSKLSGLAFPPAGWRITQPWGFGYALEHRDGMRAIIDCSKKADDRWWVHVSVSYRNRTPSHTEMVRAKVDFFGNRYAYAVYPPSSSYVNIHEHCLHLWGLVDSKEGAVLPEFSDVLPDVGRSI